MKKSLLDVRLAFSEWQKCMNSNLHYETKRCKAGEPMYQFLGLKSNRGFREKLAEREESMARCRLLFHNGLYKHLIIHTINIRPERSDWNDSQSLSAWSAMCCRLQCVH